MPININSIAVPTVLEAARFGKPPSLIRLRKRVYMMLRMNA
jgi:hypothetical protein